MHLHPCLLQAIKSLPLWHTQQSCNLFSRSVHGGAFIRTYNISGLNVLDGSCWLLLLGHSPGCADGLLVLAIIFCTFFHSGCFDLEIWWWSGSRLLFCTCISLACFFAPFLGYSSSSGSLSSSVSMAHLFHESLMAETSFEHYVARVQKCTYGSCTLRDLLLLLCMCFQ